MTTINASSMPRRYSDEEKAKAAQRLGLHPSNLSRWLRQYRSDQGKALPVDSGLLGELSNCRIALHCFYYSWPLPQLRQR